MSEIRDKELQKAHEIYDKNRNLLTELKWQREYFKRGYISKQEELFNRWIFDSAIKALEDKNDAKSVHFEEKQFSPQFQSDIADLLDVCAAHNTDNLVLTMKYGDKLLDVNIAFAVRDNK